MSEGIRGALGAITLALACLAPGCGQSAQTAACYETVDVLTAALERCGVAPEPGGGTLEHQVESSVTMGQGCGRVVSIRDERALRDECFPALRVISCADLEAAALPASCRAQIEVRVR